jgi:ABC-2 type transport system permease protein
MKGLARLLKKELKEQFRTNRLFIVGGVFTVFALLVPLSLYFMPEIMQLSGETAQIELPPPTSLGAFNDYAGFIAQFGILIAVMIAMGAIANERKNGTALVTLSKPIKYGAFISAKFLALSTTILVSMAIAAASCYGYTVWIIGEAAIMPFIWLNLIAAVFLMFCMAMTMVFSSVFKSSLAAGGMAMGVVIGLGILSSLPVIGDYLPSKMLGWGINLLNGTGENYWWALGVTVVGIFFCLYFSQRILKTKEI